MSEQTPPTRPAPRRRLRIALAVLVALVLGVRAALPMAAKRAIGWAAEHELGLEAGAEDVDFGLLRGRLTVEGLWLAPPGEGVASPSAGIGWRAERVHLDLTLRELPSRRWHFSRARIEGLTARVEHGADGRIALLPQVAAAVSEMRAGAEPSTSVPADATPPAATGAAAADAGAWPLRIDAIAVRGADLRALDGEEPAELASLTLDELDVDEVVVDEAATRIGGWAVRGARLRTTRAYALAAMSSGEADDAPAGEAGLQVGRLSIEGSSVSLSEGERSLDVAVEVHARDVDFGAGRRFPVRLLAEVGEGRLELDGNAGLEPAAFAGKAIARQLPLPELALLAGADAARWARSGSAELDIELNADANGVRVRGAASLADMDWADPQSDASRLAWKRVYADVAEASIPLGDPTRAVSLRLALLRVVEPQVTYTREPFAEAGPGEEIAGASPPAQIALERVEITGGALAFTDRAVSPVYETQVRELELTAREVDPQEPSAGQLELAASLNGGSRLSARGGLGPGRKLDVSLERLALPPINGYADGIGLHARQGGISLDSTVQVEERRWEVDSNVVLHRLRLDRERSEPFLERIDLPFELVLALLRDANGDVQLPVSLVFEEGQAQAGFAETLVGALRGALLATASAPLRTGGFLISLAGGEVSLKPLPSEPGRPELEDDALARAARLGDMLEARPDLVLGVTGRTGPADRLALARAALLKQVAGGVELPQVSGAPPDFLERRHVEEALRQRAQGREAALEAAEEEFLARALETIVVPEAQLAELAAARATQAREAVLASGRVDPVRVVLREAAPPGEPGVVLDMQRADADAPAETPSP